MLIVSKLNSYYGKSKILSDVSINVGDREIVSLIGRNGAGKSTFLKSIVGIVSKREGDILFKNENINKCKSFQIIKKGISYVPEVKGIFPQLTVEENLKIATKENIKSIYDKVGSLFPVLYTKKKNRGIELSGGERQMLKIAMALTLNPSLLLLDEPSQGLAPKIIELLMDAILKIKESNISILLVEQTIEMCVYLTDRVFIIEQGEMVYSGNRLEFISDVGIKEKYLAI